MAIIHSPLGTFQGHIGSLTFYENRQGENLCKSSGYKRKKSNERQKEWECRFATVSHAAPYLQEVLRIGFPGSKNIPGGTQGFIKANIRTATEYVKKTTGHDECNLIFERLKLSTGSLELPELHIDKDSDPNLLTLTHRADPTEDFFRFTDDLIYAVLVSEDLSYIKSFSLGRRNEEIEQSITLSPTDTDLPHHVHLYAFATTDNGIQTSDTVYLGKWI